MKQRLLLALLPLTLVGILLPAATVGSQEPDVTVRIVARQLADGFFQQMPPRVEFGLRQCDPDGNNCGDEILPSSRFFPADATVDRWLRSSPLDLVSTGTAQAEPPSASAPRTDLHVADNYWSDDRTQFYVVVGGLSSSHTYCEVHLTRAGRRIGEWSNELWSGQRSGRSPCPSTSASISTARSTASTSSAPNPSSPCSWSPISNPNCLNSDEQRTRNPSPLRCGGRMASHLHSSQ